MSESRVDRLFEVDGEPAPHALQRRIGERDHRQLLCRIHKPAVAVNPAPLQAAARQRNLREITLFPMNQQAQDLLMNAPSPATPKQLMELSLRVMPPVKKD